MSSISLPLKMMLAASALAGLTMLACGEDAPSSKPTEEDEAPVKGSKDGGGGKKDAGKDAGKRDAAIVIPQGTPGEECTGSLPAQCDDCGEMFCATRCEDGVWGECVPALSLLPDSGGKPPSVSTDAGTFSASDGQVSVKFGDSSVVIPPTACPAPLVCSSSSMAFSKDVITMLAGGAAACIGSDAIGFPPACQATADCTAAGLKLASCIGNYCIQICK
jgi:hypothetical protein